MNLIYVPCKNTSQSRKIASSLIQNKLAFCTNIIPTVYSIYLWKGKVEKQQESLLLVKTTRLLTKRVMQEIKKLHSYSNPEILVFSVEKTTKKIETWITEELG